MKKLKEYLTAALIKNLEALMEFEECDLYREIYMAFVRNIGEDFYKNPGKNYLY